MPAMSLPTERPALWMMGELIAWARSLPLESRRQELDFGVLLVDALRTLSGAVKTPIPQRSGPPVLVPDASAQGDKRRVIPLVPRGSSGADCQRLTIGRADKCDVLLALPGVSRVHAYLHRTATDAWEIEDAGSTMGTTVQGEKLAPGRRVALTDNARLSFGDISVCFRTAAAWRDHLLAIVERL